MKVLLVKTSSLGDVVHVLPAITEAKSRTPALQLTWVVEEGFADIARAHPSVDRVIPVAIRRWRGNLPGAAAEVRAFLSELRDSQYDLVLDSQGLVKSAAIALAARGTRHGYDGRSAREPVASWCYRVQHAVATDQHAILRQKALMAAALGYTAEAAIDYGIPPATDREQSIMLLHGTTWASKEWPVSQWSALARLIANAGYELLIPAGSDMELRRAGEILSGLPGRILDRLPLPALMDEMRRLSGIVSVDTGLGHLGPALGIPVMGLFGATSPQLTGMKGQFTEIIVSDHLPCIPCRRRDCQYPIPSDSSSIYPPCFEQTTPETVWLALQRLIGSTDTKPG